jgi:arylformamidase
MAGMIHDITRPIGPGCVVYPGDTVPLFREEDSGQYRTTEIVMSSHSGTHIDAPAHYFSSGRTVDAIPFSALMGRCRVIDCSGSGEVITAADLAQKTGGAGRILIRTSFSGKQEFDEHFPALSPDAAHFIAGEGIVCIGTDAPSIEGYGCSGEVHRTLLSQGIVIIELLDLSGVEEGDYNMIALPLRLKGADGAPCRVLLFEEGKVPSGD